MPRAADHGRMLGDLITASPVITLEQLPEMLAEHTPRAGWPEVLVYVVDLQQTVLSLLGADGTGTERRGCEHQGGGRQDDGGQGGGRRHAGDRKAGDRKTSGRGEERARSLPVEGTAAGQAFQLGRIVADSGEPLAEEPAARRWWVPLLDGTERLGVLRVTADTDISDDAQAAQQLRNLAGLIALLLVSKQGSSDSYAQLVRRRGMNVAAEMAWRLMPPRTFATDRVLISAVMEPAYEVSGDVFDYGVAGDVVHLSLFDAMGHDTAAGLTASLAVAASRSHRRQDTGLLEAAQAVERALTEQFGGGRYATGILAELNTCTGELTWTNHGHHPPVILRRGRTALPLRCPPAPPMGTDLGLPAELCHSRLEPGDRLLLYTDGITEARNRQGEEFGLDRFTGFLTRHHSTGLSVPETLRRLIRHHLQHHQGHLNDDATVLLLEWNGPTAYRPTDVEALAGLPEYTTPADSLRRAWETPTPAGPGAPGEPREPGEPGTAGDPD
ncbi:hypothetical protein GCM10018793_46000 [Streptomyces sulfonofaciens]|uniref:PPM-type phosphatase domain-containing protein n=1 Tax=Streptomyces sulfonofaciens TaxID=68272 RepID=A0A919L3H1_9ACTN|nr:PP2C family protein-serine/threonine phosphatase [Streptomyces sulfonofaciens]GHH83575.1 hypothetical protein GCM10018793_46000 [Streptomyces sulfonofaciens]